MGNQVASVLAFLIGEIPFFLFFGFLIYIFWVRPKRIEERRIQEENENMLYLGDRILFNDGMVGELVEDNNHRLIITSGVRKEKFKRKAQDIYLNLSCEERKKKMYTKRSLKDKVLGKR